MTQTVVGVFLVLLCTVLEGVGQVFLKKSVLRVARWYFWIAFGIIILALETIVYTEALQFLAVGAAYAITSLNLIFVTLMSWLLLREKVTQTRWIGVVLICIGVALVASHT
ncbi:MAG: EamA family transporter [Verrucomicrobia bacterium]|nr:EamA family transporter [Verrucomicrobiota bacterium]